MDAKTLAALIAGAEKWDRNALAKKPEDAEIYGGSCELCKMFCDKHPHYDACLGCPVMAATGDPDCAGTPWGRASEALSGWENSRQWGDARENSNARARFRRAAKAEAKFLRSLIPKGAP